MFLSKYGVARHIYIPIVKRAVVDFAVGADWTPSAGDVKISKDGGAAANVTNLPTAIAMGNGAIWDFSLTATEMQAAQVIVTVADSATKAVEDQSFIIETYGNASGQHAVDLADSVRAGLTAIPNVASGSAGALLVDGTGTAAISNSAGKVLLQATQSGVTIPTVTTVTNQLTAAAIATGVWTDTTAGDFTTALSVGKSVMNGVALGTGLTVAAVSGAVGSVAGAVGSVTGNVGGSVASVTAAVSITGDFSATMKASLENGVWDATMASHVTAGSTGAALNAAGGAGDPWITALPGAYAAGSAGFIIGTNLNAKVGDVKLQTDKLTFTVANKLDVNVLYVNGTAVTGAGTAANPWGPL